MNGLSKKEQKKLEKTVDNDKNVCYIQIKLTNTGRRGKDDGMIWRIRLIYGALLGVCTYTDHRTGKISNQCILFGLGLGILMRWLYGGIFMCLRTGVQSALVFTVFYFLWQLRMVGGGDVKLFLMASVYLAEQIWTYLFLVLVCNAVYGLWFMVKKGNVGRRFSLLYAYVNACVREQKLLSYPFETEVEREDGGIRMAYGAAAAYVWLLFI